jgi:flagellar basal body rod protein FlgG
MNIGLYQSAASLSALERWQDAVSQNITSSQVTGYKRRTVQVAAESKGEVLYEQGARADHNEGLPALFPHTRYAIAFNAGENQPTRRDLDVAVVGDGFFTVQMPDGENAYTRSGELQMRADRTLINAQGLELLSDGGFPIQLKADGGLAPVITADGTIRQGDAIIGKLAIARTDEPLRLRALPGGLFKPDDDDIMKPVEKPVVQQGYLESSNVAPLREMVDLVTIARSYEANQKLIQSRDKLMERTLETFT